MIIEYYARLKQYMNKELFDQCFFSLEKICLMSRIGPISIS